MFSCLSWVCLSWFFIFNYYISLLLECFSIFSRYLKQIQAFGRTFQCSIHSVFLFAGNAEARFEVFRYYGTFSKMLDKSGVRIGNFRTWWLTLIFLSQVPSCEITNLALKNDPQLIGTHLFTTFRICSAHLTNHQSWPNLDRFQDAPHDVRSVIRELGATLSRAHRQRALAHVVAMGAEPTPTNWGKTSCGGDFSNDLPSNFEESKPLTFF